MPGFRRFLPLRSMVSDAIGGANGGSAGARTQDQYLKRVLLYQLSYRPVEVGAKHPPRAGRASYTSRAHFQPLGAFAGIRFNRSAASREASLSGYFCVTSSRVLRASAYRFSSYWVNPNFSIASGALRD